MTTVTKRELLRTGATTICQSPIGEGIGKPRVPNTNPQWKHIVNREWTTRPPVTEAPAVDNDGQPAENRQLPLVTWWLNGKCLHWWVVLWCLLLGAVWPVLMGWDCANPTHETAYNKDKMCNKDPLHMEEHLGHKFHVLQLVKIRESTGYSCQLEVSLWTFRCGVWGHFKVTSVPTLLRPTKIDPEACRELARTRVYTLPGKTKPLTFQLNHPLFLTVNMVGALVNSPVVWAVKEKMSILSKAPGEATAG